MKWTRLLLLLASMGTLAACSTAQPWRNNALRAGEAVRYDGRSQFVDPARSADILVIASFSGGGSRAAAFAHSVLAELDRIKFTWSGRETSLAAEIDMVTGVSGGSVAAAHFAYHGLSGHLARFTQDFLVVDFQSRLIGAALNPVNSYRMTSPWFGRGNLLAEAFDELLFEGATFATLSDLPGRPYLIVGATDLVTGAEFDFASDQMMSLCTSIDQVPLAFAVAASSSVPLVFSPMSLQNHARGCPAPSARLLSGSVAPANTARERLVQAELGSLALDERRHLHLVDGGFSDNLGMRRIADYVAQAGGVRPVLLALQRGNSAPGSVRIPRRIVFISVNSERVTPLKIESGPQVPTTIEVLDAMIYGSLSRYSKETSMVFTEAVELWRRDLQIQNSDDPRSDVDIFLIELKLSDIDDRDLRERVLAIPTAFRISDEDRALLRKAAASSVAHSQELRRLLASMSDNNPARPTQAAPTAVK